MLGLWDEAVLYATITRQRFLVSSRVEKADVLRAPLRFLAKKWHSRAVQSCNNHRYHKSSRPKNALIGFAPVVNGQEYKAFVDGPGIG
jgi:hypothetical protein